MITRKHLWIPLLLLAGAAVYLLCAAHKKEEPEDLAGETKPIVIVK